MFDALKDTPQEFQTKLIDALNSLGERMQIPPTEVFNQVLCKSDEGKDDLTKKLYNWWRAFFEILSKCDIPKDRMAEYNEKIDALMAEIMKSGDNAVGGGEEPIMESSKQFSDEEIMRLLDRYTQLYGWEIQDVRDALDGNISPGFRWAVEQALPVDGHPAYSELVNRMGPVMVEIVRKNGIYKESCKDQVNEDYEEANKSDEDDMLKDFDFAVQHIGEIANKVKDVVNFVNPYCGTTFNEENITMKKTARFGIGDHVLYKGEECVVVDVDEDLRNDEEIYQVSRDSDKVDGLSFNDWVTWDEIEPVNTVGESAMDETEVRDFVKSIGFKPDSDGIDYETQLVDALTGKDTSHNAGWGAVYYNSDKVLQFLKKHGMLGTRGIKQSEAISKLKRLYRSGKWKEEEPVQQEFELNEAKTTMKKMTKERGGCGLEPDYDDLPDDWGSWNNYDGDEDDEGYDMDSDDYEMSDDERKESWRSRHPYLERGGGSDWVSMDDMVGKMEVGEADEELSVEPQFKVGDKVCWTDPETDETTCGWTVIAAPEEGDESGDEMYTIEHPRGSEAEVYVDELEPDMMVNEAQVVVDANDVWDVLDLLDDEVANKNLTDLINSHVRTEEEIMDAIDGWCDGTVTGEAVTKAELNDLIANFPKRYLYDFFICLIIILNNWFVQNPIFFTYERKYKQDGETKTLVTGSDKENKTNNEQQVTEMATEQEVGDLDGITEFINKFKTIVDASDKFSMGDDEDDYGASDPDRTGGEVKPWCALLCKASEGDSDMDKFIEDAKLEIANIAKRIGGYELENATKMDDDYDAKAIWDGDHAVWLDVVFKKSEPSNLVSEMTIEQEIDDPWKLWELLWGQGKENLRDLLESELIDEDTLMMILEDLDIKNLTSINDAFAYDFPTLLDMLGLDGEAWSENLKIVKKK